MNSNVVDFIFNNFAACQNYESMEIKVFERLLFENFLKKRKIILLLDGFDEIVPFYDKEVLKFIEDAEKLPFANLIVTTRPHLIGKFSNFHVIHLQPFTVEKQIEFIEKCVKNDEQIGSKLKPDEIKIFANKALQILHFTIKDYQRNTFMISTPLHAVIYSEIIIGLLKTKNDLSLIQCFERTNDFNLHELYFEFIVRKNEIATIEKGEGVQKELVNNVPLASKRSAVNVLEQFKRLAFAKFFTPEEEPKFSHQEKHLMLRYGIVTDTCQNLYFIHQSFAEYFLAQDLLESIIENDIQNSKFSKHFIEILTDNAFIVVRTFLDCALSKRDNFEEISEQRQISIGKFLIYKFRTLSGDEKNFLHRMLENDKQSMKTSSRRDFIFIGYLILKSLLYCEDNDDLVTIKKMLEMPWNGVEEYGKFNIFPINSKFIIKI
jgi:hypothetical protein